MKIKHQLKVPVKLMAVINVARTEILVEKVVLGHLEILVIQVNLFVDLAMQYSTEYVIQSRSPQCHTQTKFSFYFI